jgi:thioredoxin-dependent peroxiredoxin
VARLTEGTKAPAFTLTNQRGERVALRDFADERVIVYFYPANDTPGCTKEACQFNDELAGLRGLGVHVLGVSPDDGTSHAAFAAKYGLGFDLLSDPSKKVMESYGAWGEKLLYGKRVIGVIRSTFVVGVTGDIEHVWYGVRADGHAARVRAALAD